MTLFKDQAMHRYQAGTDGILRAEETALSIEQKQTGSTFGYKWQQESTFDSAANTARMKAWLLERYLPPTTWLDQCTASPVQVLDAGCGAGLSGFEYWGDVAARLHYTGVELSAAITVAKRRAASKGFADGIFIQDNICTLPFQTPCFDIIFSEGVLHHTDSTAATFQYLCQFLKPGGFFMFYVYRKKGPIREFTDDYIRDALQALPPEQSWEALKSLTQLGITLGELDLEIEIPEDIPLLNIPAGPIKLQRLFYWHIFKAFYDPSLSFDEMHHMNFDWYAPAHAHRHTVAEVRAWCEAAGLSICHMDEQLSGITCVAKRD